jgi:Rieske Fe-S protein
MYDAPMPEPDDRRSFLKRVTLFLGAVVTAVVAVPAVRYLLYPVRRRIVEEGNEAVSVASDPQIRAGAPPVRVEIVVGSQKDAWAKRSDVRLGAAWLVRGNDGQLHAFSTTCPHLGCAVDYDEKRNLFRCPCHTSAFELDGSRAGGPAKRGLDPLETVVEDGTIKVRFLRFKADTATREKA